jgi:hypothetical protein
MPAKHDGRTRGTARATLELNSELEGGSRGLGFPANKQVGSRACGHNL